MALAGVNTAPSLYKVSLCIDLSNETFHAPFKGTEDVFFNSADIKNINSTQQIKFKELTKRFYI